MAFPQVGDTATSGERNSTTSHTVDLPTTVNSGETLIVFFCTQDDTGTTFPTGWTEFIDENRGMGWNCAWRLAGSSEGGTTITVTTANARRSATISMAISGAADPTSSPPTATHAQGTSNYPNPPSHTPTAGADDYLWIACFGRLGDMSVNGWPTNYVDNREEYDGEEESVAISTLELNDTDDNPAFFTTNNSNAWIASTITITPGAAGTNTQINIADSWKEIAAMQINIADSWKEIASAKMNIGDAWKDIF